MRHGMAPPTNVGRRRAEMPATGSLQRSVCALAGATHPQAATSASRPAAREAAAAKEPMVRMALGTCG